MTADTPEAGGLLSLPKQQAEGFPLVNPGFEDALNGWDLRQKGVFAFVSDGDRTGAGCLRFDAGAASRYVPSIRQTVRGLRPGVHTLRFWVKTIGLKPPQRGKGGVRVSLEYYLSSGKRVWPSTPVFSGTLDWRPVELNVLLPADLRDAAAVISVHRYGKPQGGEALLDDFTLERLLDPPVEAFLRYPNYRGFLAEDAPQRVRLWVKANAAGAAIQVTKCADGSQVASVTLETDVRERVVELDAAGWPLGRYSVQAKLGEYEYPAYIIHKISAQQRRQMAVWFDEHNVLHLQGRPVFPIGFYNTVRLFATVDDEEITRLDKLVEAPTNFMINYTWWPCTLATRRHYLDEMYKRGIWYLDTLMPFKPGQTKLQPRQFPICNELLPAAGGRLDAQDKCDRFLTGLAQAMRGMPGHAGWYVMDERPFGMVPAIFRQYCVLRRADPDHPTYGVSNKPREFFKWRDTLDVFGLDPYPLMNMKLGRPLSLAGEETRAGINATQGSRPLWMVIQFFQGWRTDRWPTEEELRTMSLMAIVEGARGLFYWSFGIRALLWVKDPSEREDYWQRAVRVTKELKSLEPALIAPDAPGLVKSVSDDSIRWRARQAQGHVYVFAYRPAKQFQDRLDGQPVEVTFSVANGKQVRRSLRPDRADWLKIPLR